MAIQTHEVTKQVFDLDAFNEIPLGKQIQYEPVTDIDQALEKLSNDSERLVKIINQGLLEEAKRAARNDDSEWRTYSDEGALNGPYTGTQANPKKVNVIVLGLAKSVFGFRKDMDKDEDKNRELKRKAKEAALEFIKSNPTIREGLKKNAAFDEADEDEVSEVEK